MEDGAGEDDEEEADCQDEGQGDDCFEASGRHGGHLGAFVWLRFEQAVVS